MTDDFNKWWDEDDLTTEGNNFVYGTPAYWAWDGWCAGAKAEREACAKRHELAISKLNAELTEVYGLLGMAHLNIQQHLEHGFNKNTAVSTLISVGRYYPRLKAEMEHENDDDL